MKDLYKHRGGREGLSFGVGGGDRVGGGTEGSGTTGGKVGSAGGGGADIQEGV